jgi:hypothetical protein
MKQEATLTLARLKAPRAAAIAGILFAVLLIADLGLFRLSVRADPLETGAWLKTSANKVALVLNLVPFAGIAFLWFMGVLRDRLGELEDRFFATVFLGSGLLFLAVLFAPPSHRSTQTGVAAMLRLFSCYAIFRHLITVSYPLLAQQRIHWGFQS